MAQRVNTMGCAAEKKIVEKIKQQLHLWLKPLLAFVAYCGWSHWAVYRSHSHELINNIYLVIDTKLAATASDYLYQGQMRGTTQLQQEKPITWEEIQVTCTCAYLPPLAILIAAAAAIGNWQLTNASKWDSRPKNHLYILWQHPPLHNKLDDNRRDDVRGRASISVCCFAQQSVYITIDLLSPQPPS